MALLEKPDRERGFTKERILRVLLNHADGNLTKYQVAQRAEASEPWTRQYTEQLQQGGLLSDTEVVAVRDLYEEWLDERIAPNQLEVSIQQPMEHVTDAELQYGLTTYHAENLHQGLLFASTTDFYVAPDETERWLEIVEEHGLLGGGNTRLRALDEHVFYNGQTVDGFATVSIPQLVLDLLEEGGPCEEAAQKLVDSYHGDQEW